MTEIDVLGKPWSVIKEESDRDTLRLEDGKILIEYKNRTADILLKDYLASLLHSQLHSIYDEMRREGRVEVFGNLDFEIMDSIDNKRRRIAKLRGNNILVKLDVVALPEDVLRYVIAHELAHTYIKRHTSRFWKTVELMYPNFRESKELLERLDRVIY